MRDLPSVWPAISAFVLVIALIPVVLWVLKRVQAGSPRRPRLVTLAGGVNLGPRERVVVVEAQGRRWLLGVTAQAITPIAELDPNAPDPVPTAEPSAVATPPASPFSQLLDAFKRHD